MVLRILRGVRRGCVTIALYLGLVGFVLMTSPALAIGPGSGPGKGGGGKGPGGGPGPGGHGGGPGPGGGGGGPGPGGGGGGPPEVKGVPEIDPGAAASALALLAGGTLILIDRNR